MAAEAMDMPLSMAATVGDIDTAMNQARVSAREAAISMEATARYSQDAVEASRMQAEVQREFLSDFSQTVESISEQMSQRMTGQPGGGIDVETPGETSEVRPVSVPSSSEQKTQQKEQVPPSTWLPPGARPPEEDAGPVEPGDRGGGEQLDSQTAFRQQSNESSTAYLRRMRGMSFQDIGKSAQSSAAGLISNRIQSRAETLQERAGGNIVPWTDPETGESVTDDEGNEVYVDEGGNIVRDTAAISAAQKALKWSGAGEAVSSRGIGGAIAGSNIGKFATRVAGPAALAFGAADQVKDFAVGQREANLPWQRLHGGSNFEGFSERGRSQLFEMEQSWFNNIGAGTAEQIYQQAAEVFTDQRGLRNLAQEFSTSLYKNLGVGVEESMSMIATAAESGNKELIGLSDAITNVTEVADEANVNAQMAQQNYMQSHQRQAQLVGGQGAPGTAAVLTQPLVGLGPEFADKSIQMDESMIRQIAQSRGESFNQTVAALSGQGGASVLDQGISDVYEPRLTRLAGGRQFEEWAREQVGDEPVDPVELGNIADQAMEEDRITDLGGVTTALQQNLGMDLSYREAAMYMTAMSSGQLEAMRSVTAQEHEAETQPMDVSKAVGLAEDEDESSRTAESWREVEDLVRNRVRPGDLDTSGDAPSVDIGSVSTERLEMIAGSLHGRQEDLTRAAIAAKKGDETIPILEEATRDARYDQDRRYVVETAEGKMEATLGELLEHGFADQFATGQAVISEGRGTGQTVGQYFGEEFVSEEKAASAGEESDLFTESRSDAADEFEDEDPEGRQGKITLEMGRGLRDFIDAQVEGRVILGPSAGDVDNDHIGGS